MPSDCGNPVHRRALQTGGGPVACPDCGEYLRAVLGEFVDIDPPVFALRPPPTAAEMERILADMPPIDPEQIRREFSIGWDLEPGVPLFDLAACLRCGRPLLEGQMIAVDTDGTQFHAACAKPIVLTAKDAP